MIRMFLAQIMFLSKIPVPFKIEFNEDDLVKGVIFAPAAGFIIGAPSAGIFFLLSSAGLTPLAVASAIMIHIVMTGALHLDGLADTADGFFSYRSRDRILEIMKDSRIGTNGALSLIAVVLIKYSLLISLKPEHAVLCLIIAPVAARMTIAWTAGVSIYARIEDGMGKSMVERTGWREILISSTIALLVISAVFRFSLIFFTIVIVLSAIIFSYLFSRYSLKKIGGMTGDVIGAVIELSEILVFTVFIIFEKIPQLRDYIS